MAYKQTSDHIGNKPSYFGNQSLGTMSTGFDLLGKQVLGKHFCNSKIVAIG